jgi:hypothetical protein
VTTETQRAANARNAQRSTGPRTEEGKARSSRNALKHGAFATRADAISASILQEDPTEVYELVDAIINELDPLTPLEQIAAQTVANRILARMRVERLDVPLTEGVVPEDEDIIDLDSHEFRFRLATEFSAALFNIEHETPCGVDWGWLLSVIRFFSEHGAHFDLEQTWPDGTHRVPRTEHECCVVLQRFIDANFGDIAHAREHVDDQLNMHQAGAEAAQRVKRSQQAQLILKHYERTTQLTDRVDRSVTRAIDNYRNLIADRANRDSEQIEPTRNEPNPDI